MKYVSNEQSTKRVPIMNSTITDDVDSTIDILTLRTESYRHVHPLQSFTFDYPKQSSISKSMSKTDNRNSQPALTIGLETINDASTR